MARQGKARCSTYERKKEGNQKRIRIRDCHNITNTYISIECMNNKKYSTYNGSMMSGDERRE